VAGLERPVIKLGGDRADGQARIDRQAQPHLVNRHAGLDLAAPLAVEVVGLGVDKMALDIEQAVLALVAVDRQPALVQAGSGFGVGQRHRGPRGAMFVERERNAG